MLKYCKCLDLKINNINNNAFGKSDVLTVAILDVL